MIHVPESSSIRLLNLAKNEFLAPLIKYLKLLMNSDLWKLLSWRDPHTLLRGTLSRPCRWQNCISCQICGRPMLLPTFALSNRSLCCCHWHSLTLRAHESTINGTGSLPEGRRILVGVHSRGCVVVQVVVLGGGRWSSCGAGEKEGLGLRSNRMGLWVMMMDGVGKQIEESVSDIDLLFDNLAGIKNWCSWFWIFICAGSYRYRIMCLINQMTDLVTLWRLMRWALNNWCMSSSCKVMRPLRAESTLPISVLLRLNALKRLTALRAIGTQARSHRCRFLIGKAHLVSGGDRFL